MQEFLLINFLLIAILLILSAAFSSSETALFSLDKVLLSRLKKKKARQAESISSLLNNPRALLSTILIGNELVNTSIAVLFSTLLYKLLRDKLSLTQLSLISVFCGSFVLLVVGEITPKAIALRNPQKVALLVTPLIKFTSFLVYPFIWFVRNPLDRLLNFIIGRSNADSEKIDEAVFKSIVEAGRKEGIIEQSEKEMINRIFAFDDLVVSDVMTPRTEIFMLPVSFSYQQLVNEIKEKKFSRVPIFRDTADQIVGIIYAKDLLKKELEGEASNKFPGKLLNEALFIPPGKKVVDLFRQFKALRQHMAIVVDEYGGLQGLVTMEDLLEELFGEIRDEYDQHEIVSREISADKFHFSGRESLVNFCQLLNVGKPNISGRTVNGLFLALLGHLPQEGAKVSYSGWQLTALKVSGRRISLIEAAKLEGSKS